MYKKLLLIVLLNYVQSISSAQHSPTDSIKYAIAHDSIHHIVFDYPAAWHTRTNVPYMMFYAEDTSTSFMNFRTNLIFMRYRKVKKLPDYLDWHAEILQKRGKNIQIIEKFISENQYGIVFGRIKNYSSHKGLNGYKTHIYFPKGDSYFMISFANLETDEEKYNPVVEHIIQSIQFYGTPDANEVEGVGK